MNYRHHIIRNFPPRYPVWKKIWANCLFFFGGMVIHRRKNLLTNLDCIRATNTLQKGDVVLVGGLRRVSSMFIGNVVTHAMLYAGHRLFVHSVADGVETDNLHSVFSEYDTMIILRPRRASQEKIRWALEYAFAQVGKPYDFEFKGSKGKFYCTKLIADAWKFARFNIGIRPADFRGLHRTLQPIQFLEGNFDTVYLSHNLQYSGGNIFALKPARVS